MFRLGATVTFLAGILAVVFGFTTISYAGQDRMYPRGPDLSITPGSTCDRASEYRYPEKVKYCQRNVESSLKQNIIREYDERLGFHIRQMSRQDFKIDHLIPLCAGGSNDRDNLWPQHKSVFVITDPLEQLLCEKMAAGALRQQEAIRIVIDAKMNLESVPETIRNVQRLN